MQPRNNKYMYPVIIDCDPGADDALGLLVAFRQSEWKILGITTVYGNGPAEQTAKNAAKVCALAGRSDVLIYPGAGQPLTRTLTFSTLYCGADGLCETGLPDCNSLIAEKSAHEFLIETLKAAGQPVTVVCTGGLTNVALALLREPEIRKGIREIVTASGYFGLNPKECRAEWNIYMDPEAAKIVYESGIPIRAIGLDVTCMLEDAYVERILNDTDGPIHDFMAACTAYNQKAGLAVYSLLNDAMTVAAAAYPELASYETGTVTVYPKREDAGQICFAKEGNGSVRVASSFDFQRYLNMLREIIT